MSLLRGDAENRSRNARRHLAQNTGEAQAIDDLAAEVAKLKGAAGRRDEAFQKSFEAEKLHGKVLEKKFDELFKQAKENPTRPAQARHRFGLTGGQDGILRAGGTGALAIDRATEEISLFISQCDHRVDARRAAGRYPAGRGRYTQQKNRHHRDR